MARFGNEERLTPTLDSLYHLGLGFDRVYATGNRTVRGLEAVTLSLPPCPGQSIIKRADNTSCTTLGEILAEAGYEVCYFYGGNAYFDNMESFFGGNGYRIVDQKQYTPEEITFSNIWGVCDEDSYRKALGMLRELSEGDKPFFAHLMSVSNHRPFTYPAGKISIPHDSKSRKGGVMYSDYALGEFFRAAANEPWFENTLFLIAADHCASSAGSTEIPLEKYHIPAVIYAPKFVAPRVEKRMVSQIDLTPTLLDVAGIGYRSPFYGRSVFEEDYTERAFVATYQDLGYIEGDCMTILSPVRRMRQLRITPSVENPHATEAMTEVDSVALNHAIAYYQFSE
jgi:phosphoglycerol transferase MdoB-like AlkP superfamily enzyme